MQVKKHGSEEVLDVVGFLGADYGKGFRVVCVNTKGKLVGIPNGELTVEGYDNQSYSEDDMQKEKGLDNDEQPVEDGVDANSGNAFTNGNDASAYGPGGTITRGTAGGPEVDAQAKLGTDEHTPQEVKAGANLAKAVSEVGKASAKK